MKLTKSKVEEIPLQEKGQRFYFDSQLKGFGVCVGRKSKTYIVQRDVDGKTVRVTVGRHGVFTTELARKKAQEILVRMVNGDDPRQEIKPDNITLKDAFDSYLETRKQLSAKTINDYTRSLNLYLKDWMRKTLEKITKDMVFERHRKLGEIGHSTANLVMRILRAVYNHAKALNENLPPNPVSRLGQTRAWYRVERRRNIIKNHNLHDWYQAVINLPNPTIRDYLILLLFSGMRKGEAAKLKWKDVDLKEKKFVVPETKTHEPLVLPLSDFLWNLLNVREIDGEFVFPGTGKTGHLVEPKKAVKKVVETSGINFMIHDLRRTFISIAESLDIPAYALKRLLNHKISGDVTAGYIITDVERLRVPMQKITDFIVDAAKIQ